MRIVVADDLLLEQAGEKRLQFEGVGDHAEALVSRLLPGNVVRRERVGELLDDEFSDLLLGPRFDLWRRLEIEPDRLLDHRYRLGYFGGVRAFVFGLLTLARRDERQQGAAGENENTLQLIDHCERKERFRISRRRFRDRRCADTRR